MRHYVNSDSKTIKNLAIAVAEYHLLAVPERVLIFVTIVDAAGELQPAVIQRISLVALPEKLMGDAEIVIGFINGHITVGGLPLKTDLRSR